MKILVIIFAGLCLLVALILVAAAASFATSPKE